MTAGDTVDVMTCTNKAHLGSHGRLCITYIQRIHTTTFGNDGTTCNDYKIQEHQYTLTSPQHHRNTSTGHHSFLPYDNSGPL